MTRRSLLQRGLAACLVLAALLGLSAGCTRAPQAAETTVFAMDTVMSLTIYGDEGQEALSAAVEEIYRLQNELSVTDEQSAISALNAGAGEWVELNSTAADLLAQGLALCQLTDGALDLTACSAVQAWGFLSGEYRVPEQDELDALAASIDYTAVEQDGTKARLPAGMTLDLGSVAKGYTGDLLTQLLMARGVTSAILDLGHSSIQAVGTKPDGSPWRVGLQDPDGEDYLAVVTLQDQAMGTSGGYQRYFESDGVRYWHIIDPQTAAPARSGLASVTVIGPSGLICDGLSTALFVMGQEKGAAFWRNHPELDIQVIFISENGDIAITSGLSGVFSLATGYESREVTILE